MKVHPVADLLPMMSEEEIQFLAASIAENGLFHPIVVDNQNQIVDGRNRLRACEIAGVPPRFERIPDGWDVPDYIISANILRQSLTRGQQAMIYAMLYPEPGGRPGLRVEQARQVLRNSHGMAEGVMRGVYSLDHALSNVREQEAQSRAKEAQLKRLHEEAPDLAEAVDEQRMTFNEALAALEAQQQEIQRVCKASGRTARTMIGDFCNKVPSIHDWKERLAQALEELREALK